MDTRNDVYSGDQILHVLRISLELHNACSLGGRRQHRNSIRITKAKIGDTDIS